MTEPAPSRPITRLLLCHADAAIAQRVKAVVQPLGTCHVTLALEARTVIDKLHRGHFHGLLLGEQIPDLDAWRLARLVQTGRFCPPTVPLVLLCPEREVPLLRARASSITCTSPRSPSSSACRSSSRPVRHTSPNPGS